MPQPKNTDEIGFHIESWLNGQDRVEYPSMYVREFLSLISLYLSIPSHGASFPVDMASSASLSISS